VTPAGVTGDALRVDALYIEGGVGEPATADTGVERGVQGTK